MTSNEAYFIDRSGREQVEYRPLRPVIVRAAEIEAEIARLAALDSPTTRRGTGSIGGSYAT